MASPVDEPPETVTIKKRFGLAEPSPAAAPGVDDGELQRLAAARRLVMIDGRNTSSAAPESR